MAQFVGSLPYKLKGHKFESQSGHMPVLWVRSPVGVHARGSQLMFLSHINVSLSLSLSPPTPPRRLPLSLKSMSTCLGEDLKNYILNSIIENVGQESHREHYLLD